MTAALLKIVYANGAFEERAFAEGSYEIGRDSGAIVLNDAGVSARHARLDIGNGQVWLSDLGSSNGTIDETGARVGASRVMRPHETFRLGASSVMLLPPSGATVGMPQFNPALLQAAPAMQQRGLPQPVNAAPVQAYASPGYGQSVVVVPSDWSHRSYDGDGPRVVFGVETGMVTGCQIGHESHMHGYISSSGGGTVRTTIVRKCEFVLRSDDGRQHSYTLTNIDVILRDGQRVSLLWGKADGARYPSYLRLVHHETEALHRLDPAKKAAIALGHAKAGVASGGCLVALLGTLGLLFVMVQFLLYKTFYVLWVPSMIGLLVWAQADARNNNRIMKLDQHAARVGAELLAFVVDAKRKLGL